MSLSKSNVVLAVLAAALAVPTVLQLQKDRATFVDAGRVPLLFDGFTADNVGRLRLRAPKKEQPAADPQNPQPKQVAYDEVVFAKTDKGWLFAEGDLQLAPVSKERIETDVMAHLRAIRADRETLVVANATTAQLEKYGLDEAHAFVVQAVDTTGRVVVAELLVGNDAGGGQAGTDAVRGVFVRKSESTDVVLYELERGWLRSVQTEYWLDKVLAKLDPDRIHRFAIRNAATAGTTFTFARLDGKASWSAIEPPAGTGAVRQGEIEALVQRLRWIAAQDFRMPMQRAGNPVQLGLQPPQIEIEMVVRDGERDRTIKLAVGNRVEGKNEYYLTSNESAFLMTWPSGTVTPFELDVRAQLFDPAAPPAEVPPVEKPGEKKDGDDKGGK